MMRSFILGILAVVFIVGCVGESESQPVCNEPYILVGTSCCIDQNNNLICDSDEEIEEEPSIYDLESPVIIEASCTKTENPDKYNPKFEVYATIYNPNDVDIDTNFVMAISFDKASGGHLVNQNPIVDSPNEIFSRYIPAKDKITVKGTHQIENTKVEWTQINGVYFYYGNLEYRSGAIWMPTITTTNKFIINC